MGNFQGDDRVAEYIQDFRDAANRFEELNRQTILKPYWCYFPACSTEAWQQQFPNSRYSNLILTLDRAEHFEIADQIASNFADFEFPITFNQHDFKYTDLSMISPKGRVPRNYTEAPFAVASRIFGFVTGSKDLAALTDFVALSGLAAELVAAGPKNRSLVNKDWTGHETIHEKWRACADVLEQFFPTGFMGSGAGGVPVFRWVACLLHIASTQRRALYNLAKWNPQKSTEPATTYPLEFFARLRPGHGETPISWTDFSGSNHSPTQLLLVPAKVAGLSVCIRSFAMPFAQVSAASLCLLADKMEAGVLSVSASKQSLGIEQPLEPISQTGPNNLAPPAQGDLHRKEKLSVDAAPSDVSKNVLRVHAGAHAKPNQASPFANPTDEVPEFFCEDGRPCGPLEGNKTNLARAVTRNPKAKPEKLQSLHGNKVFVRELGPRLFEAFFRSFKEKQTAEQWLTDHNSA